MINKIEKLAQVLNESYNEKSLYDWLEVFFNENFGIKETVVDTVNTDLNSSENEFNYPLFKHKKCIGYLKFSNYSEELKNFLDITAPFISLKIQNILLSEKMQKNIDFHDTMKNIAKIIETQYELHYIIPIIGEMLDKFFPDYLIYIFLRDKQDSYTLSWPGLCKDKFIIDSVNNLNGIVTSEDGKTCILPLINESKQVGILAAKSTSKEITEKDNEYLEQLSIQIATTINRANAYAQILKHATLDALTGFYNRHQLEERIKQEVSNAKRQHAPLCGIMTDIDFFKNVNDTYGHAVGDIVLKTVAKVIRSKLREYDIAGRYGGEEFSILLPFTKINEAQMVAERLRKSIEEKVIDISKYNTEGETKKISVTVSLGIYEIKETDNDNDFMQKADKALYQAKNTGRNKVVINYE